MRAVKMRDFILRRSGPNAILELARPEGKATFHVDGLELHTALHQLGFRILLFPLPPHEKEKKGASSKLARALDQLIREGRLIRNGGEP